MNFLKKIISQLRADPSDNDYQYQLQNFEPRAGPSDNDYQFQLKSSYR